MESPINQRKSGRKFPLIASAALFNRSLPQVGAKMAENGRVHSGSSVKGMESPERIYTGKLDVSINSPAFLERTNMEPKTNPRQVNARTTSSNPARNTIGLLIPSGSLKATIPVRKVIAIAKMEIKALAKLLPRRMRNSEVGVAMINDKVS